MTHHSTIPEALTERPQWVIWRSIDVGGKPTKIPYQAHQPRAKASSTNASTWATYADACTAAERTKASGVGYVFSADDGLVGVDLDDCRNPETGAIAAWAWEIIHLLNTYTEISPSGTGVKAWLYGEKAAALKHSSPDGGPQVEIYSTARYFAVTGECLPNTPPQPEARHNQLATLRARFGKPTPPASTRHTAPTPIRPLSAEQPPDSPRAHALIILQRAVGIVERSQSGQHHHNLLKAATLAGGVLGTLGRAEVEDALLAAIGSRHADERECRRVIASGLNYGEQRPIAPAPSRMRPPPVEWRNGSPHCPQCGDMLYPSRFDASGLYCRNERHGSPKLSWRGADAEPPALAYADNRSGVDGAPERDQASDEAPAAWLATPRPMAELVANPPPPVRWFAPNFLREGLGILVGMPNIGKTPLLLQLALALASGTPWMGVVPCKPSRVLFWGSEYTEQEIYPVISESAASLGLVWGRDVPAENLTYLDYEAATPDTPEEAIDLLSLHLESGYDIIMIDTMTAWLPEQRQNGNGNAYRGDYKELSPYHRLALRYRAAILGSWHNAKREADPRLMFNGTMGIWGVPSSRMTMYLDKENRVWIASQPRLGDFTQWPLRQARNLRGRHWEVADVNPEPALSGAELEIWRWLQANASNANPRTPNTIAEMTGINPNTIRSMVKRLTEKNLVGKAGAGYYAMATVSDIEPDETPAAPDAYAVPDEIDSDPEIITALASLWREQAGQAWRGPERASALRAALAERQPASYREEA